MVLDGGTTAVVSTVGSAANVTLRISQFIYELKAVGEQTQDLLASTNHISATLQSVRTLRRQKSRHLSTHEKTWIDGVVADTDGCLRNVAALVEPARVDLQTKSGRIGLFNRGLWVFRDSPKVATNLARLNLTNQSLNSAMVVLCSKGAAANTLVLQSTVVSESRDTRPPPPSYNEFLNRHRIPRVASVTTMNDTLSYSGSIDLPSVSSTLDVSPTAVPEPELSKASIAELEAIDIARKDSAAPEINITEVTPHSGSSSPQNTKVSLSDSFAESDGLQVVEDPCSGLHVVEDWSQPTERSLYQLRQSTAPTPMYPRPHEYARSHLSSNSTVSLLSSDNGQQNQYYAPRPTSTATNWVKPSRAKSRGRAWLESQSEL